MNWNCWIRHLRKRSTVSRSLAAQLSGLPISAVSLTNTDRPWFKSRVGVGHSAIPRDKAPCAQVTDTSSILLIPDLLAPAGR